jgi:hypothetical protein
MYSVLLLAMWYVDIYCEVNVGHEWRYPRHPLLRHGVSVMVHGQHRTPIPHTKVPWKNIL